jgi:squamous cell carcinoma antigen recognized by T-cells 3
MNSKEEAEKAVAGLHGQEFMTRALHCELSKPQPKAKRQQTTQISSASPEPSNIDQHKNGDGDRAHYKERSIAILDLPDTVNDAKVRSLCEPYGPLRKIKLLHDHQGAIVEYVNVGDARKAGLAIDGREIIPGRRIRIGTVAEMLKSKEEFKHDKLTERKKPSSGSTGPQATLKLASGFVSRPAQAGAARRGGRGGLGFRTGKVGTGGSAPGTGDKSSSTDKTETTAPSESKKSQADFRAMLGSTN